MQNYFAYIMIRKDKIVTEGERVQLDTGYNGNIHKITPRVTYVRDALHESLAVIPTRSLVTSQIINVEMESLHILNTFTSAQDFSTTRTIVQAFQ